MSECVVVKLFVVVTGLPSRGWDIVDMFEAIVDVEFVNEEFKLSDDLL